MKIRIYDHSYHEVVSGGDVIAAEFAKAWIAAGHSVLLSTHTEAASFFSSRGIPARYQHIATHIKTGYRSVLLGSIAHVINAVIDAYSTPRAHADVIFAGSWSLQDLLPAVIDTYKNGKAKLAVGCYIFIAPPWKKTYGSNWLNRVLFWLEYQAGILLVSLCADIVWTASAIDAHDVQKRWHKPAMAIRGGVDIRAATRAVKNCEGKKYDAVYIGRFHPQKNILELVDIWKNVASQLPTSTLRIYGAGFLKKPLEEKIRNNSLECAISVLPPIDGDDKFALLASTKIFVSASHSDTGNLALDEALACGVPGVIYDLPKLTYPMGVTLIKPFDIHLFSERIIGLLTKKAQYERLSTDARNFAENLDWKDQADQALESIARLS